MKKILVLIAFVLTFFFTCSSARAENFYITNYDVNMWVKQDKSVKVLEKIDVVFTNPSHGIFRNIPLKAGEGISVESVSEMYRDSMNGNNFNIKIGSPDTLVSGPHHYQISYNHQLKGKPDEFYYNIIGTGWDVPINKVSFYVHMPSDFDPNAAGLSIGSYGTRGFNGGAEFKVYKNEIFGKTTTRSLKPHEGITLRVSLPKDYFTVTPDYTSYYALFAMLLLTGISVLVWYFIGRDEHVTPVVNFYPPENYNSAEVEVLYSGKATEKGLVSLIIWLANKGYLKIDTRAGDFTITKVKDFEPQTGQENLSAFIDMLVPSKKISGSALRSSPSFYKNCSNFIDRFNRIRERIFEKDSISFGYQLAIGLCLGLLVILECLSIVNFNLELIIQNAGILMFPLIAIIMLITSFKQNPVFMTLWAAGFGGIPLFIFFSTTSLYPENIPITLSGIVCIIISGICLYQLPKRNKTGNKLLGQLLGFKKFLETVEVARVQSLVDENPNYCFDVLPYLYVFGLSEKWINQFEQFFKEPPEWYSGDSFDRGFNNFARNTASYTQPSEANGGVSHSSSGGGGGFSGGGSGGGGGGSW